MRRLVDIGRLMLPVVTMLLPDVATDGQIVKRPLFVLLDATWSEAGKMFRKCPYLNHLPVLSLHPEQISSYRLRRSSRSDHFCTSEVGALCLALAGEPHAAAVLDAYLEVFTHHYLQAKNQQPLNWEDAAHQHLRGLCLSGVTITPDTGGAKAFSPTPKA